MKDDGERLMTRKITIMSQNSLEITVSKTCLEVSDYLLNNFLIIYIDLQLDETEMEV